jgi:hypothetical protein
MHSHNIFKRTCYVLLHSVQIISALPNPEKRIQLEPDSRDVDAVDRDERINRLENIGDVFFRCRDCVRYRFSQEETLPTILMMALVTSRNAHS